MLGNACRSSIVPLLLTPPTIEIVGFPGGGGKAYHHAAYKAASYAVSHHTLRVQRMTSIQPKWLTNILVCIPSSFKCILRREFHLLRGSSLTRECRAPGKLLFLEPYACRKVAFILLQALYCIFVHH